MKSYILRWMLVALLLAALAFTMVSPASAEVTPLPLDHLVPGNESLPEGWSYLDDKEANEGAMILKYASKTREWSVSDKAAEPSGRPWERYEDDSITMEVSHFMVRPAYKPVNIPCIAVHVKVADPSQIRTAMSYDRYDKKDFVHAEIMAKHVNAVVAVNGDFFKYHYKSGYVVRQGEFYCDALNGKRDLLLIDNKGNFHSVFAATTENTTAYIADMNAQGLDVINTFTLGPVLVQNGEARLMKDTITASKKVDEFQWCYPQQRVAICQLGELEYVIIEAYGKTDSSQGMTLQELADLIVYLYPDCIMAYNLDGGGSTNVIVNGERIHKTPGRREISDILYFASAHTEGTESTENTENDD